jgi:hypothetical protein
MHACRGKKVHLHSFSTWHPIWMSVVSGFESAQDWDVTSVIVRTLRLSNCSSWRPTACFVRVSRTKQTEPNWIPAPGVKLKQYAGETSVYAIQTALSVRNSCNNKHKCVTRIAFKAQWLCNRLLTYHYVVNKETANCWALRLVRHHFRLTEYLWWQWLGTEVNDTIYGDSD